MVRWLGFVGEFYTPMKQTQNHSFMKNKSTFISLLKKFRHFFNHTVNSSTWLAYLARVTNQAKLKQMNLLNWK